MDDGSVDKVLMIQVLGPGFRPPVPIQKQGTFAYACYQGWQLGRAGDGKTTKDCWSISLSGFNERLSPQNKEDKFKKRPVVDL